MLTGQADVTLTGLDDLMHRLFRPGMALVQQEEHFMTRNPIPLTPFYSTMRPFSLSVWLLVASTLAVFCLLFRACYNVYNSHSVSYAGLAKHEPSPIMFFMRPFLGLTEPEVLPWFNHKWSSGRLATLLWSIFLFLFVQFYCCNLRASMTVLVYEEPIH